MTTDAEQSDTPVLQVTFARLDSAAFEVRFAGVSPAMFAAIASWCSYMSTKGYAERDYGEAMRAQAARPTLVPASVMPSDGRN